MYRDFSPFFKKKPLILGGLGFSAGLPIMLVFSTLSEIIFSGETLI